jgi:signal transduction histidine kinase
VKFSWRGLTPQLFLVVILPLTILLLTITFGGLRMHQLSMRSLVGERDMRAAQAAANALSESILHRKTAIQSLAFRVPPAASPGELQEILSAAGFLMPDFDLGLAFYTRQYDLMEYRGEKKFWSTLNLETAFTENSTGDIANQVTLLNIIALSGTPPVLLAIYSPQPESAITVGASSLDSLFRPALADVFANAGSGFAFVVDQERRVLFEVGNKADAREDLPTHPGISEALNGESGSTFMEFAGAEHVIAFSPIKPVGWALIIEEPWHVLASPLLRLTEYAPLVLIPILFLALLALWFGTNRIVQPLRSLEERASALGWGDFDAIERPVGGIAEIRHLQSELILLAKKVKSAQQGLHGYIRAMTRGLEEERRRLARELHDETLQSLIALNQRIQISLLSKGNENDRHGLEELQGISENTIQELRRVTRALRPLYLEDLGLVAALEMLTRETQQLYGIEIQFQQEGTEQRLDDEVELALYRMAQETLNNAVRHANAKQIVVTIYFSDGGVTLKVADDGQGFVVPESPSVFASSGHYGLLGLYERAELIGARLGIHAKPGRGAEIIVHLAVTSPTNTTQNF